VSLRSPRYTSLRRRLPVPRSGRITHHAH
jgi:hypothetical protein